MIAYCVNPEHKRITKEVKDDTRPRKKITAQVEDSSCICFVNSNGEHITPRKCQCGKRFKPTNEARKVARWINHEKFEVVRKSLIFAPDGKCISDVISVPAFRKLMLAVHGKCNPECPIEDEHMPIDENTAA